MPRSHEFDPPLQWREFERTRLGQALLAGRLVATVKSPVDGTHITLRFACKAPPEEGRGRWELVPFHKAKRCYVDVPGHDLAEGDNVGDLNLRTLVLWQAAQGDDRRALAAKYTLLAAAGRVEGKHVQRSKCCLRCGIELTDPESIRREFGPECIGRVTGSQHQTKGEEFDVGEAVQDVLPEALEPVATVDDLFHPGVSDVAEEDEPDTDEEFVTVEPGVDPRSLL